MLTLGRGVARVRALEGGGLILWGQGLGDRDYGFYIFGGVVPCGGIMGTDIGDDNIVGGRGPGTEIGDV